LQFDELARLIAGLMRAGRIVGADVAIFDPELDPKGTYAGDRRMPRARVW